ncbi:MAG: hypothetical protein U1A78_18930 [Polyangia bacterium]
MTLRDPVLMSLLAATAATVWLLFERRARSQMHQLDAWAAERRLSCEREVPLGALAPLEPLATVPEVASIQRGIQGHLQVHGVRAATSLFACKVGNRRRPQPFLLAVLGAPQELPTLRILPQGLGQRPGLEAAPQHLGFVPMPSGALPEGFQLESFQPLPRVITQAIGEVLRRSAPSDLRVELRPGRVVLALPMSPARPASAADRPQALDAAESADLLLGLAAELVVALAEALDPNAAPPDPAPGSAPGSPPDAPPNPPANLLN